MPVSGTAAAARRVSWSYSGATGPENWAKLAPEFASCSGKNQSPIDLKNFVRADLEPIGFSYRAGGRQFLNDGHTVKLSFEPGSRIVVDGIQFHLAQLHFHTPGENLIRSRAYPMEAHLVQADRGGNLAVVAVMFEEGAANPGLAKLLASMPQRPGDEESLPAPFDASALLPSDRHYYRYDGSLTTPPCSEGVRWFVMRSSVPASQEQLAAFRKVMGTNNRPVQPVNARLILEPLSLD